MKPYTCLVTLFLAAQTVWALNPHPRIWLTPTLISTITTKMNANDAAWVTLKANADTLKTYSVAAYDRNVCAANTICYSYEGSGWYEAMIRLALVYKITGDVSYAAKAKTLLIAMNAPYKNSGDLTPIQLDSGYPTRFVMPALAIGYDWLYDYLDSGTKTDTINTVNAAYTWISTGASPAAYCMAGSPCSGPPYMNYFGGHMLGLGAAADATDGDNATSTAMYNWVNSQLSTALGYGLQAGPSILIPYQGYYLATGGFNGGAVPESYSYGTSHAQRLWQLLLLWKTSGRSDFTGTYSGWLKTSVKNLIYTLRPNLWQVGDEGDYAGNCSGALHADYPLFLAYILNGTTEGAWS